MSDEHWPPPRPIIVWMLGRTWIGRMRKAGDSHGDVTDVYTVLMRDEYGKTSVGYQLGWRGPVLSKCPELEPLDESKGEYF